MMMRSIKRGISASGSSSISSRAIKRRAILGAALMGCGMAGMARGQTSGSWIGSNTGNWTTPSNWAIISGSGAYPDSGGAAFLNTGTTSATNITLDTGITLDDLDASLAAGSLSITGTNTLSFTGAATVLSPVSKTLTFAAPVATGTGTLTDVGNFSPGTIAFNVGFTGNYVQDSFNASGITTTQITNNFQAMTGSVTVNGGTFNLNTNSSAGSNGTFGANTTVTLNAGSVQVVNNSAAAGETQAKINNRFVSSDSTIINSGTLQFFGTTATVGGVNTSMGQLTVYGGSGAFGLQTSNAGADTQVNVTNFLRSDNGALLLRGEGLGQFGVYGSPTAGQKASFLKISNLTNEQNFMANNLVGSPATTYTSYTAAASTATDLPIVPWLVGDLNGNAAASGIGYATSFVTYMADSGGNGPGFVVLGPSNFVNTLPDGTISTSNFSLTGATTLNSNTTVNSLILNDTGGVSGSGVLTITSGALAAFKNAQGVTVSNNLQFGASNTSEAVIDTGSITGGADTITLTGQISTSGGLTKTGPGTVYLNASNSYTGTTTVGEGTLEINDDTSLGAAPATPTPNSIQLSNSVLNILTTASINANRGIAMLGNATLTMAATVGYNGVIANDGTPHFLTKSGFGALVLGNANSNFGTLSIINGPVYLGATNGIGANTALRLGFSSASNTKTFSLGNSATPTAAYDQTVSDLAVNSNEATPSDTMITNAYFFDSNSNPVAPVTFTVNDQANDSFAGQIAGNLNLAKSNTGTLVISGNNSYAGQTMLDGGVLSVSADNNLGDDAGLSFNGGTLLLTGHLNTAQPITVGANGGTLDIGTNSYDDSTNSVGVSGTGVLNKYGSANLTVYNLRTGGLSVAAGTVTVASGRDETNKTSSLSSIAVSNGAALDLGNNDLVYNYNNAGNPSAADPTQAQAIRGLIAKGYNGGAWNGTGGITSNAAAATTASLVGQTALGYSEASTVGITGTYNGQPVDANTIVIRYTYSGDADLDGTVSSNDFALLAANYNKTGATWNQGDFNYDGTVNALDFNMLASNYGQIESASLPDGVVALGAVVPEPSTIGLLLAATTLASTRRSRRKA